MEIKAKICKVMPSVEGEGRNGHYKFTPFIIEWDEIENGRSFTQSAKVDFSEKTVKVADLAALVGTSERVLMSLYQRSQWQRSPVHSSDGFLT